MADDRFRVFARAGEGRQGSGYRIDIIGTEPWFMLPMFRERAVPIKVKRRTARTAMAEAIR